MDNENRPEINYDIKLPDAELDVMMAIWSMDPPATSPKLMKRIGNQRGWKAPTLISFLLRLEERGFIESYKKGKERCYIALADRDTYLERLTCRFVENYHGGSVASLLASLYRDRMLDNDDIDALLTWLKAKYN